jgi:hypothetical protein
VEGGTKLVGKRIKKVKRSILIPEDLYGWFEEYASRTYENVNSIIIKAMREYKDRRVGRLFTDQVQVSTSQVDYSTAKVGTTEVAKATYQIPEITQQVSTHQVEKGGQQVQVTTQVPEVTQQVKEEPVKEEVATETSEPVKSEFPPTELPLTGAPSSKPVQEISSDFSWAKKTDKFDDLIKRWEATFVNWSIEDLVKTWKRCLDYPTRRAVINILVNRFNGQLPEIERATIWNFFKGEDVGKWLDENKLSIKMVEEGEKKKMVLEAVG